MSFPKERFKRKGQMDENRMTQGSLEASQLDGMGRWVQLSAWETIRGKFRLFSRSDVR